jgi:hypothetical protein
MDYAFQSKKKDGRMKLLVFHEVKGREIVQDIRERLQGLELSFREILVDGDWASAEAAFDKEITADARIAAVVTGKACGAPWFAYIAGLCRGRGEEAIAYSRKAVAIPALFRETVIPLSGRKDLKKRLPEYIGEWIAGEKAAAAKKGLLDMGIPFSEEAFCDCVRAGKAAPVHLFLLAGFSADTRDEKGTPLLCLAARTGGKDLVTILLEAGAEVNALSPDRGGSALIDCALGKYHDIAALLLKAGADVNVKSRDGQSALIISVGLSDEPFVEMLLRAGANVDEPDALGVSARKYAVLFSRPEILELFKRYAKK